MPSCDYRISTNPDHDTSRLVVDGEVDCVSIPVFRSALDEVLTAGSPSVEVDLSGVAFFGCAGLTALIEASNAAADRGVSFRTIQPSDAVGRVLLLTGLYEHVTTGPGSTVDSGR